MNNRLEILPEESTEVEAPVSSQVQLLRSRVEAELKKPAVVLVTSARHGDGKSFTANSLAASFAKSGHRTALVSENRNGAEDGETTKVERPAHGHFARVHLPPESDNAISREGLTAFVNAMRSGYDYTVVDAGSFFSNSAMALTRLVDGILLTVRVGRPSSDEDEMMVRVIEAFRGNVVGVVATDAAAIADFERNRSEELAAAATARPRKAGRKPARALVTTALSAVMLVMLANSAQTGQPTIAGPALTRFETQVVRAGEGVRNVVARYAQSYPSLSLVKEQQTAMRPPMAP
ncbi:MAG TPA: hypothetical protein VKG44_11085 [Candidatus Baltobacteraceae bacterium]|nr:hypothetical protein [Candidatus Baltobacteraceae bacterium]